MKHMKHNMQDIKKYIKLICQYQENYIFPHLQTQLLSHYLNFVKITGTYYNFSYASNLPPC